jgi:histidine phosphotransferase ChpT
MIGPVGALGNGIEILADEDDPSMREQATQLLGDSADEAARRLRFYRLAFGASGGMAQAIPLSEARVAALGLYQKGRIMLEWSPDPAAAPVDKSLVKLLLNMILLAATALPRGGTLAVRPPTTGREHFIVTASGAGARIDPEIGAALAGGLDPALLDTHNVVAYFAAALARDQGLRAIAGSPSAGLVELALERI